MINELLKIIFVIEWLLAIFIWGLIFFKNINIYYSLNRHKYKWFPILNPFLASSYELFTNSLLTFKWKEDDEKKKLKRSINKLSSTLGKLILLIILTVIFIFLI